MDVPGFVFMLTMTVPVSSSGISPVFVTLTSSTSNPKEMPMMLEAIGETAREVLPSNYTYEFGGISREESKTTNNATLIRAHQGSMVLKFCR